MSLDAGQTRGSWETTGSLGEEAKRGQKLIFLLSFCSLILLNFPSGLPVGQQVHAHQHDLVCQTRPERKNDRMVVGCKLSNFSFQ